MGLRFIPRVETRGYDVVRPCRDFLAHLTTDGRFTSVTSEIVHPVLGRIRGY